MSWLIEASMRFLTFLTASSELLRLPSPVVRSRRNKLWEEVPGSHQTGSRAYFILSAAHVGTLAWNS
jgi:hypothetical protein